MSAVDEEFRPSLPYAGTEGHNDTDTSRDAAWAEAMKTATVRQRLVMILLRRKKEYGMTVKEFRDAKDGIHHGRASSALTSLHATGRIVALLERRTNATVYVLPEYVNERPVRPYVRSRKALSDEETVRICREHAPIAGPGQNNDIRCLCTDYRIRGSLGHAQHVAEVLIGYIDEK